MKCPNCKKMLRKDSESNHMLCNEIKNNQITAIGKHVDTPGCCIIVWKDKDDIKGDNLRDESIIYDKEVHDDYLEQIPYYIEKQNKERKEKYGY